MRNTNRILGITLAALALGARPAAAQLAHASATTLGLAGNATATARGLAAISVNPAGLGMPGSGFTLTLVPVQVRPGLDPITMKDLKDFEGITVPTATKNDWLQRVVSQGTETGSFGMDVTEIGLAMGHIGFQVSTSAFAEMNMSPQIVELILFGNAGKTGSAGTFALSGSSLDAFAVTTAGLSLGIPLHTASGSAAIGGTLKYLVGHGLIVGRNSAGSFTADKITFDFPMLMTNDDGYSPTSNGNGVGLDVGFQLKNGALGLGATLQNLVNTFKFDEARLNYRPVTGSIDANAQKTDVEKQDVAKAPASLRGVLDDMKFKPSVAVGVSYDVNRDFTVAGDIHNRFGDGLSTGPKLHIGGGAEFRGLKVLHLRAGLAKITDGVELGGGGSLVLGPLSFSVAGAKQSGDVDAQLVQLGISFGGR